MLQFLLTMLLLLGVADAQQPAPDTLECAATDPCEEVLPGAVRFERPDGKPYAIGYDSDGNRVGWVVLSNHVVDIKGYSGKPMSTLVGLDPEGTITGGKVVAHSEPILLVGIPESELHDFVGEHVGVHVDDKVAVGAGAVASDHTVDIVSGATVTVLAQNRTIMDSARQLAQDVGVIEPEPPLEGHWVEYDGVWSWDRMVDEEIFGRLEVGPEEMGPSAHVDLWFTLADPPQIGRALLGEAKYEHAMKQVGEGEHLVVILNQGPGSFKGSGFVRGGIFDRVRLEQGLTTVVFRDLDYWNLPSVKAEGAPHFREGGVFIARNPSIDPGRPFELTFLGSAFTLKGGFARDFEAFEATHEMPQRVYKVVGGRPHAEDAIWKGAWATGWPRALGVGLYLLAVGGLFVARKWMSGSMKRLEQLHNGFLIASFLILGVWLHVQPSITQLLTLIGGLAQGEFRWRLFLSDPLIFVSWIFIAVTLVAWGRGVFCGWVCPYGAMSELLHRVGQKIGLPNFEFSDPVHKRAKYLRYGVLAVLVVAFLIDPPTGEKMAEVEPFKSTFFVPFWQRSLLIATWWLVLAGASLVWFRPFCRYLCPLGAGLALPSTYRVSGPYRRDFCSSCKICYRGCEPRAIDYETGEIDPRECLNCWECEANWRDDTVCPPLVKARRDREKHDQAAK